MRSLVQIQVGPRASRDLTGLDSPPRPQPREGDSHKTRQRRSQTGSIALTMSLDRPARVQIQVGPRASRDLTGLDSPPRPQPREGDSHKTRQRRSQTGSIALTMSLDRPARVQIQVGPRASRDLTGLDSPPRPQPREGDLHRTQVDASMSVKWWFGVVCGVRVAERLCGRCSV